MRGRAHRPQCRATAKHSEMSRETPLSRGVYARIDVVAEGLPQIPSYCLNRPTWSGRQ